MSSAGAIGDSSGAAAAQHYYCHQCSRTVSISPSPDGDLSCPICNGGFVEELEHPIPNPNIPSAGDHGFSFQPIDPIFPSASAATGLPFFLSPTATSFDLSNSIDLGGVFGSEPSITRSSTASGSSEPFNPSLFLQNYIQTLTGRGATVQVVVEGSGGPISGGNLGDYFIGPGLEQLIQQLAENDPNRYGTPPASKSSIEALPVIKITENLLSDDEAQCAVCKDVFEVGAEVTQMPCKHMYHKDCILPWLELHNSCPVCRYELPTDDPSYEQRVREETNSQGSLSGGTASGSLGSGSSAPNSPGIRVVERRFIISLPWPLRASASQSDGRNDGEGGDGNLGGHGGSGTQTRQEQLD